MNNTVSKKQKMSASIGIAVASLLIVFVFCGRYFSQVPFLKNVANFFLGCFGMSFYGIMSAIIVYCSCILSGKKVKMPSMYIVNFAGMFVAVVLLVHVMTTTFLVDQTFATYAKNVYNYYDNLPTFGGIIFGSIAFALEKVLTFWGATILTIILVAITLLVAGDFFYGYYTGKITLTEPIVSQPIADVVAPQPQEEAPVLNAEEQARQRAMEVLFSQKSPVIYPEQVTTHPIESQPIIIPTPTSPDSVPSLDRTRAEQILFGGGEPEPQQNGNAFFANDKDIVQQDDFVVRGYYQTDEQKTSKRDEDDFSPFSWKIPSAPQQNATSTQSSLQQTSTNVEPLVAPVEQQRSLEQTYVAPLEQVNQDEPFTQTTPQATQTSQQSYVVSQPEPTQSVDIVDIVVNQPQESVQPQTNVEQKPTYRAVEKEPASVNVEPILQQVDDEDEEEIVAVEKETKVNGGVQVGLDFVTKGELRKTQEEVHVYMPYNVPPLALLNDAQIVVDNNGAERQKIGQAIVNKLAVYGIKTEHVDSIVGPSVTRYLFKVLSEKTRMSDFKQYADDLKACIEAQDDIRIEAPVKGTNLVGIEVANKVKRQVVLRSIIESVDFQTAKGDLVFAIGQEITGKTVLADLADMPHLLVAGTTGSGKSVCLNCLIVSMMYRYSPEYVRFVMVDPKYVELSRYNGIPHMLTTETITAVNDALAGMDYLISEMDARYQLFRQNGVGNIKEYNQRINPKLTQKLPYLVFVVDELADLMSASKQAFESKLQRLAQKSRAAGIHIVLATQRPDVKTITGTIKANLPCRMALKVSSQYDSATIVGCGGAEKLLGKGDMLYLAAGTSNLERVQCAYISNDEIRSLVDYSKQANEIYYDQNISQEIFVTKKQEEEQLAEQQRETSNEQQLDPLCGDALRFWLEKNGGKASIASIQRNLGVGFNRAGRIMNALQELKYVEELSASDTSSKPLRVLITLEEVNELFPKKED